MQIVAMHVDFWASANKRNEKFIETWWYVRQKPYTKINLNFCPNMAVHHLFMSNWRKENKQCMFISKLQFLMAGFHNDFMKNSIFWMKHFIEIKLGQKIADLVYIIRQIYPEQFFRVLLNARKCEKCTKNWILSILTLVCLLCRSNVLEWSIIIRQINSFLTGWKYFVFLILFPEA